jgi:hypothetical protein
VEPNPDTQASAASSGGAWPFSVAAVVFLGATALVAYVLGGAEIVKLPYTLPREVFDQTANLLEWRDGIVARRLFRVAQGVTCAWWLLANLLGWSAMDDGDRTFWRNVGALLLIEVVAYAPMVGVILFLALLGY